jgi:hypothetical protein
MTKRVTELTDEQRAQLKPWADKWVKIGLSCEPADFDAAGKAIRDCYRLSGLAQPKVVIPVSSPMVMRVASPAAEYGVWLASKLKKDLLAALSEAGEGLSVDRDETSKEPVADYEAEDLDWKVWDNQVLGVIDTLRSVNGGGVLKEVRVAVEHPVSDALESALHEAAAMAVDNLFADTVKRYGNEEHTGPEDSKVNKEVLDNVYAEVDRKIFNNQFVGEKLEIASQFSNPLKDSVEGMVNKLFNEAIHDNGRKESSVDSNIQEDVRQLLYSITQHTNATTTAKTLALWSVYEDVDRAVEQATRAAIEAQVAQGGDKRNNHIKTHFDAQTAIIVKVRESVYSLTERGIRDSVSRAFSNPTSGGAQSVKVLLESAVNEGGCLFLARGPQASMLNIAAVTAVVSAVETAIVAAIKEASPSQLTAAKTLGKNLSDHAVKQFLKSKVEEASQHLEASVVLYTTGNLYSWWPAFESFFTEVCKLELPGDYNERAKAYRDACTNAGWSCLYKDFAMVCDRPEWIKLEDRRLHSPDGYAIKWRDGFGLTFWRGTHVPEQWILGEKPTAAELLKRENVEERRAGFEIIGWDALLTELNAKVIDQHSNPQIGALLEADIPDSGTERFLKVECGTGRSFVIPVPPTVDTAVEAQAWTYGFDDVNDFLIPEVRT